MSSLVFMISSSFMRFLLLSPVSSFFFFNDTATTEIYTLSLHDALPICWAWCRAPTSPPRPPRRWPADRKSTRLNSSHEWISYAVFCLKKKIKTVSIYVLQRKKLKNEQGELFIIQE